MAQAPLLGHPRLERHALQQDCDAFNRKYPVGSLIRINPESSLGKNCSLSEVETTGPAVVFFGKMILIPVALIANVLLHHLDLGEAL